MRPAAAALSAALALAAAACDRYTLVENGPVTMDSVYTVEPQIAWNRRSDGNTVTWTVDGPALEEVRFINGLEDGDRLFEGADAKKLPTFGAKMTPIEVQEFFEQSFIRAGVLDMKARGLRPAPFGNADGFRFEFAYSLEDGLEREGIATGMLRGEKLYLIVYSGTRLHFFGKYKAVAERVIASVRLRPDASP
ncbi:MAG: hypothetical protein AB7K86_15325 [Rhodospirillales bacterium]